jgi:hypothetical protein
MTFSQFKDSSSIDYMYIRYVSTFLFGVVVDQIVKGNPPIGDLPVLVCNKVDESKFFKNKGQS